ncbi:hypothetical protein IAQ61_004953 [Plenodomus lingam]|uniref:uncharacterized protein n=1 Tax=Leptosphaeria maculans TaxID=5022 RepID=UPI003325A20B|nr:hypothetical protein IAQ61_004953 [Plenodomus lingam]
MSKRTFPDAGECSSCSDRSKRPMPSTAFHNDNATASIYSPSPVIGLFASPAPTCWSPLSFTCGLSWPHFMGYQMQMPMQHQAFAYPLHAFQTPFGFESSIFTSLHPATNLEPNSGQMEDVSSCSQSTDAAPPGSALAHETGQYCDDNSSFWNMDDFSPSPLASYDSSSWQDIDLRSHSNNPGLSNTSLILDTSFPALETPLATGNQVFDNISSAINTIACPRLGNSPPLHHGAPSTQLVDFHHFDSNNGIVVAPALGQASSEASILSTASTPHGERATSPPEGSTTQWYRRFFGYDYSLDIETVQFISQRALTIFASLANPSDPTPVMYAKYVAFMMKLKCTDVVSIVVSLVMHLFFYVADDVDACLWAAKSRMLARSKTRRRIKRESELFDALQDHLPPGLSYKEFVANMKKWRKVGSQYAFLARRLSLGALVLARNLLLPQSMWGCAQGNDRHSASENALCYLEEIGLPEMARGVKSEELMHSLLWAVFGKFEEFGAVESGSEFAGFERPLPITRDDFILSSTSPV